MKKVHKKLIVSRESYRLWFEFYKICSSSKNTEIKINLENSSDYYRAWGNVSDIKFDDWWKSHGYLFAEHQVRLLDDAGDRQSDESLLVEIPLNQSTTLLLGELKELIDANRPKSKKKKKVSFTGSYQMTDGSEPKLATIRHVLNIYRDVYLANHRPKIPSLLPLVVKYYKSKKRMEIPKSLDETLAGNDISNILRNLGRWMKWADQIVLNTSKGEFPGKY